MSDNINKEAAQKHLDVLNEKMTETREDANGILTKFHFGGILVVIGLLNADLVLAQKFRLLIFLFRTASLKGQLICLCTIQKI